MTELNILNIFDLYTLRVCLEMHPFIYPNPKEQLNRPEHNHNYTPVSHIHDYLIRYSLQEHQFIPNTAKRPTNTIEHFTAQYSEVWNSILLEFRCLSSRDTFKTALKLYLLEKQNEQ